jgi:hypothetical protein
MYDCETNFILIEPIIKKAYTKYVNNHLEELNEYQKESTISRYKSVIKSIENNNYCTIKELSFSECVYQFKINIKKDYLKEFWTYIINDLKKTRL